MHQAPGEQASDAQNGEAMDPRICPYWPRQPPRGRCRGRLRRARRGQGAGLRRGRRDAARSPQLPPVPAALLPGRDRGPGAGTLRCRCATSSRASDRCGCCWARSRASTPSHAGCISPARTQLRRSRSHTTGSSSPPAPTTPISLVTTDGRSVALEVKTLDSALEVVAGSCMRLRPPSSTPGRAASGSTSWSSARDRLGRMAGQIAELARDSSAGKFRRNRSAPQPRAPGRDGRAGARRVPGAAPREGGAGAAGARVTLLLGHTVVAVRDGEVEVRTASGERSRIASGTVIWAAGVTASPSRRCSPRCTERSSIAPAE